MALNEADMVSVTIDGKSVRVPKGTNLIEAAKLIGIEIPHYCYHPNLSIAGNCRMCQVRVKGAPKLDIACNTLVRDGMEVLTQETSKEVEDAQAATLEFILINHPLDCTVCDQAGHCKLQDYHFEYNARPSRFLEEKVHKVKASPLGPTVMLDGERCIMCTRCVRFCDEVTKTSELGMLNRGDRSVIAVNPDKPLDNPLSGTVVDLCPVGALTHRNWRFNTRIWFTKEANGVCPGCSTGCNVKVAVRNHEVVQVKARMNQAVNKEWLCDEGRYGFDRFLPRERLVRPLVQGKAADWNVALAEVKRVLQTARALLLVSPYLILEEYEILRLLMLKAGRDARIVVAYSERQLSPAEAILISPDYAGNFKAAEYSGLVSGDLQSSYRGALESVRRGEEKCIALIGDWGPMRADLDGSFATGLARADSSFVIGLDAASPVMKSARVQIPGRSILEKSGLMLNRALRLQYTDRFMDFPDGSEPEWRIFNRLAQECGGKVLSATTDREATLWYLQNEKRVAGLSIADVKAGGVCLKSYHPAASGGASAAQAAPGSAHSERGAPA